MLVAAGYLFLLGNPSKVEAQCGGYGTYNYWLQYDGQWPCVQYSANCLVLDEDDLKPSK